MFGMLSALLLMALANIASAEALGTFVAIKDGETSKIGVYYLSPRVLTRTRMTPDRLKQNTFRIENKGLPRQHIVSLLRDVHSTEHQSTKRNESGYDFRLCISSDGKSTWFSSDAKVGLIHGAPFFLSKEETASLLSLFDELDLLVAQAGKQKK